ncbi:MAG: LTA synthase family protein [Clostridia bacterium]|nr:LTA synthase family protein [Clostridia bacterium]
MSFIISAILSGLVVGLIDVLAVKRGKKFFSSIIIILCDMLGTNVIAVYLTELVTKYYGKGIFSFKNEWFLTPYVHAGFVLVLGLIWIFVIGLVDGRFRFRKEEIKWDKKQKTITVVSFFLFVLGVVMLFGTYWGVSTFSAVAADQLLVNMVSPKEATSETVLNTIWTGPVLGAVVCIFFYVNFCLSKRTLFFTKNQKEKCLVSIKGRRVTGFVLAAAFFVSGLTCGIYEFSLNELVNMYLKTSTLIEDNYADPNEVKMQFPKEKRNLIHIYLESMENSYASENLGGHLKENLIKPLTDLSEEGISFSHTESFGGPMSTTGCVWSVASMVNMSTGLTMKPPVSGDNYGSFETFLPGAVTIGDILHSQGYEQSLMIGAAARFGGLDYFFTTHGNFNILDFSAAKKNGWIPKGYKEFWGFEDDKLFEFAKKEITRLDETGKPFYFVMETADTHFPGYVGKNTPTPRSNQYANVIAYSAEETVKFVRWIQKQPFYENTTVVIIGDHISMDPKFFKDFDKDYIRTTYNLILNPAESAGKAGKNITQNRYWANFDMFPTMLAGIGVKIEGERLALGTNLFSGEKTLFERNGNGMEGFEFVNDELKYKSELYNEKILMGTYKPFETKNITEY